jgi:3-oxoacyl-[acyl-carrier protein] reductase
MKIPYRKKVAVVTGAARGLGASIVRHLNKTNQFAIAINYNKSREKAEQLYKKIKNSNTEVMIIKADITKPEEVNYMINKIVNLWYRIDVLINNAGIVYDALLIRTSDRIWEDIINVNLHGTFNCIRAVTDIMIQQNSGHIVNISSISGIHGQIGHTAYGAVKAGILGLTRSAAKELGKYNIKVNAVLPGYMLTDMGKSSHVAMEWAVNNSVLNKLADINEIAKFIVELIQSDNVSGQIFTLDSRINIQWC